MVEVFEIGDKVYLFTRYLEENSISVSSFLVIDDMPALVETGTPAIAREFLREIAKTIPLEKISYIFVTHEHLDHMGGLPEYLSEAYNAKVVVHSFLKAQLGFMGVVGKTIFVNGGETIPIGNKKIEIIYAPIETKGTVVFNLQPDGILFSGDYFGHLDEKKWELNPDEPLKQLVPKTTEFHEALGYTQDDIKKHLSTTRKAGLKTIAPTHGSIIKDNVQQFIEQVLNAKLKPDEKGSLWKRLFGR